MAGLRRVLWASLLFSCLAGFVPALAVAVTLSLADQERGVFTEALSAESGSFDMDVDPAEALTLLPYTANVTSSAATANGNAIAAAALDSAFATDSLSGSGSATASANTLAVDVSARAPADSHFSVVFSPDIAVSLFFAGAFETNVTGANADAHTRIQLANASTGAVLAGHSGGLGTAFAFNQSVELVPTESYVLSATSLANARAINSVEGSSADANYRVYVPEPSFGVQLLTGCLGLAALEALRKRGGRRAVAEQGRNR